MREDVPNVSKGEDAYFRSNKIFTNIYKEEPKQQSPIAGANNKFSQYNFANRNHEPYSAAYPSYLRLADNESKSLILVTL